MVFLNDAHHLKLTKGAILLSRVDYLHKFLVKLHFFPGVRTPLNLTLKYGITFSMSTGGIFSNLQVTH